MISAISQTSFKGIGIFAKRNSKLNAAMQSQKYVRNNIIDYNEKIMDGFKDGGRNTVVCLNGKVRGATREIIVVDRKKDTTLNAIINRVKSHTQNMRTSEQKAQYIFDYCQKFTKINRPNSHPQYGEVLLGDALIEDYTCCRHIALLFKILCDEVDVKSEMVRGAYFSNNKYNKHAWNTVVDDYGWRKLYDATLGVSGTELLSRYSKGK